MQIFFSRQAVKKINEISAHIGSRLIIRSAYCQSCVGSGIFLTFWQGIENEEDYFWGNSGDIDWACLFEEIPDLDGLEIDFRSDDTGEYFIIYNQGHYIPIASDALFASVEI